MGQPSTLFQVTFKNRLLGVKHDKLSDAVLQGMSTEGYKSAFLRMDDEGQIAQTNPMRLFCGKASSEDFSFTPGDALRYQSTQAEDAAAIAEVAEQIYRVGRAHKLFDFAIQQLTYTDGALTHLDGLALGEIARKHAKH